MTQALFPAALLVSLCGCEVEGGMRHTDPPGICPLSSQHSSSASWQCLSHLLSVLHVLSLNTKLNTSCFFFFCFPLLMLLCFCASGKFDCHVLGREGERSCDSLGPAFTLTHRAHPSSRMSTVVVHESLRSVSSFKCKC